MPVLRVIGRGLVGRVAKVEIARLREAGHGAWLQQVGDNRFDVVTDAPEIGVTVRTGGNYGIDEASPSWSSHGGAYRTKGMASGPKCGRVKPVDVEQQDAREAKRLDNELAKAEHARKYGFGGRTRVEHGDKAVTPESEPWWTELGGPSAKTVEAMRLKPMAEAETEETPVDKSTMSVADLAKAWWTEWA